MDCSSLSLQFANGLRQARNGFRHIQRPWKQTWSPQKNGRSTVRFVALGGQKYQVYFRFQRWRPFGYTRHGAYVKFDQCPAHNVATWIHHLLTKVQQMKLMRCNFRWCAWLEKEWHWASVAPCLGMTCAGCCQRSFHASYVWGLLCIMWMESWCWINLRPRDCWKNRWPLTAVLHLHTNWCVHSMALCLWWAPKLWQRVCLRRCYTSWRSNTRRIFTPSPLQPCKPDFWQVFEQKPGAGDLAIESSKFDFWREFQPKPAAGDFAIEPSKL